MRGNALGIWMNGLRVGRWERAQSPTGHDRLVYESSWLAAKEGRPLSLSLPYAASADEFAISGPQVAAFFENLIPDSNLILQRLRDRYRARSIAAFDLLATLGRDCAGAIQLLPQGESATDVRSIDAEPLDEAGVARILRETTIARVPGEDSDAFRLSIAGAQEKTALLRHANRWHIPHGSTPSTHIFKLPLGRVGNMQADLGRSVELEWLCMQIVGAFGLPVAHTEIGRFEDQKALIVERFDRRLAADATWWLRIPQEDFCQACGVPSSQKYEADGGPGIRRIMEILRGSERADEDRATFFRAQLVFWLLAATDGHAKNFSLVLLPGGRYRLAPLYDILSIYPVLGHSASHIDPRRAKLAMAVESRGRHYRLDDIHRWHWTAMATQLGLGEAGEALIEDTLANTDRALATVGARLPAAFPAALFDSVSDGMQRARKRIVGEPARRAIDRGA